MKEGEEIEISRKAECGNVKNETKPKTAIEQGKKNDEKKRETGERSLLQPITYG